jgi:hypothetical protein
MAKDTYYFSHDYNARNDKKISALVRDFKASGYGIFWATCEMMHEEGGHLEFDDLTIDAIAKDLNEDSCIIKEVLEKCVDKYRLFTKQTKQNEAENFASLLQSSRIHRNLEAKNEKKAIKAESGRLGGIKSGESRRSKNTTKQNEAERSSASSNEPKERKGKEIKENKLFNTKPDFSDFNGLPESYYMKSIEFVYITKKVKITDDTVKSMWEIFKVQNLTGQEYYQNEGKVYSHFLNWIKKQDFSAIPQSNNQTASKLDAFRGRGEQ